MKFEEALKNIYLLKTPFSIVWTGIVLVQGEKNFLIDSGAEEPEKYILPALKDIGMSIQDIDYVLNTHCHGDHISGHHTLATQYGRKVAVYSGGSKQLENPAANAIRIRTKFPEDSPKPQSDLKGVKADVYLNENEIFENRLSVISTPGHETDCVCWYDIPTKTIICGDSLQGNGTLTQGIGFYQDLTAYQNSLRKLMKLDIENIVCGHAYDGIGSVICGKKNVQAALSLCLSQTEKYNDFIKKCVQEKDTAPKSIGEKLIRYCGCAMPDKLFLALYTVTQHLNQIKEGKNL